MTAGIIINVNYNGKKYTGLVDTVRTVKGRKLATLVIDDKEKMGGIGYRSLYLDKMENVEEIGCAEGYPLPFAE
jgi:hypothetical protein